MALKAAGFDIDGTLYPDFQIRRRSILFLFKHFQVIRAFSKIRHAMRASGRDTEADELDLFAAELGCDTMTAKSIRDSIIFQEWEGYFRRVSIYPNVLESLLRLKDAGLKLAALSDLPVGRKLEYFGLDHLFDATLGFPESGRLKPSAEPFLVMAERLDTDPADILYIGNKLAYDVRGAENAGMRGALICVPKRGIPAGVTIYPNYRFMAENVLSEVTL